MNRETLSTEFPFARASRNELSPLYQTLRQESTLRRVRNWDGKEPWLITRYDDARFVLKDSRFSSDHTLAGYPGPGPTMTAVRERYPTFVTMDNPDHNRYRRMLSAVFSLDQVKRRQGEIQRTIDELVGKIVEMEPPVDFVVSLALPIPSSLIARTLGVPYRDHAYFQALTRVMASEQSTREEALDASEEMCEVYLRRLIRDKAEAPGDDLISRLIQNEVLEEKLSEDELVSIGRLLLVAGHDTTANMIGLGALSLVEHPELTQSLRDDPALVPNAVEELLRFWNIDNQGARRVALEDVEVRNTIIRRGEGAIVAIQSADRDDEVFEHAEELEFRRPNARFHNAFGFGIHQCLGQHLARLELQTVIPALVTRFSDLQLAVPAEDLRFGEHMFNFGIEELPLTWTQAR